jgi:glycosyltransferase involved in cell wall biosynthesis
VVTSEDPAIREVSANSAVHVDVRDPRALVDALAAIARAPLFFVERRNQGLARAREFTWQRTARLTREVYEAARRVFHAG